MAAPLLLWASVLVVWGLAWERSLSAVALDRRAPWTLPFVLGAHVAGCLLARAWARRQDERSGLDGDRHGLALLVSGLAAVALAHLVPQMSIQVLREELPPLFAWWPVVLALVTPLALFRSRARLPVADQALAACVLLLPLSGALLLLEGPAALCLALVTLTLQLRETGGRVHLPPVLGVGLALGLLLLFASTRGLNPIQAAQARPWIASHLALAVALGARPRSADDTRLLLGLSVTSAVIVALCGALLTTWFALEVGLGPALDTRLTLFRQHPNFLAPFFAFEALVALGLALTCVRGRALSVAAAVLLAAATWHTDSRAGNALFVLGLVGAPALGLLLTLLRRRGHGFATALVLGTPVLIVAAAVTLGPTLLQERWTAGIDRFEKSVDYRLDAWSNSATLVAEHPWGGIGPRTFVSVERFEPGSRFFNAPESPHPHNVMLYVAQAGGLPALALFAAWIALLLHGLLAPGPERRGTIVLGAALLALTAANLLDVGMALDTVAPEPMFLLAGLLAARSAPSGRPPLRPGYGLLAALAIALVVVSWGLGPVTARTLVERAELTAFDASQRGGDPVAMAAARDDLREAVGLDPDLPVAYELLSRWLEDTEAGFPQAREVLLALQRRAPHRGQTSSLLGHLYLRARLDDQAVEALRAALTDGHGSVHQTRDRAAVIQCLARLGRRDDALAELLGALRLDVGVIDAVTWQERDGARLLTCGSDRPLALMEVVELLYGSYQHQRSQGREVGRRAWMDVVAAFRKAGRDDRARDVLDDLEANVPQVERHSIANERGVIALAQGDGALALREFERAHELTGNPFFLTQVEQARRLLGETVEVDRGGEQALAATGEILDQPEAFDANLRTRAAAAVSAGRPGEAARLLRRTLLYQDDLLARARQLAEVARLHLEAAEPSQALDAVSRALAHLDAKPWPAGMLRRGYVDSLPAELATTAVGAWVLQGLTADQRVRRAWGLPAFFRPTPAAGMFRRGVFTENGQPDALLREAELALLEDGDDLLARWSRLEALEGLGRHAEAAATMRDLSERFADREGVVLDRVFQQIVARGMTQLDDPRAWFEAALVRLLQGRYREAADLFAHAAGLPGIPPRRRAELLGWQARAELFGAEPDAPRRSRRLLQEALDLAPQLGSLQRRLEVL